MTDKSRARMIKEGNDYYAAYHSKTPSHKEIYKNKIDKVLKLGHTKLTGN